MIPPVEPATAIHRAHMAGQLAGLAYWWMDASTQAIDWSPNMFQIFGLEPGTIPSLEYAMQLVHPDDRAAANAGLASTLSGSRVVKVVRIVRPSGEIRYVEGRNGCETAPNGEVLAVYGTVIDVTSHKLAEQALADSERLYRLLAENATDVTYCFKPNGRITFVTPAVQRLLGYQPAELIGLTPFDVMHPDDADRVRQEFYAYVQRGPSAESIKIEFRALAKDGRELWLETHPRTLFDASGVLVEVQDVIRDITARKQLERDLLAAKESAEAATAVKGEFLANISHELRTPLTSIIGYSGLLWETSDLPDTVRLHIERIEGASRALLSLVTGLLDFSRLEAGRATISPVLCSPAGIARECLDLLWLQAEAKGIRLEYFGASVPALLIDPDAYRQVLVNLVGNAVKFTQSGFVRLAVEFNESLGQLIVTVEDSGAGIALAQQGKLFQRFSQVDGSSTRLHHGAGLGLAICKRLAEAMGGDIWVMSAPGVGSLFTLRIPASQGGELAIASGDAVLPGAGGRILVADDNAPTREMVRTVLESYGQDVVEAVDGATAIAEATARPFDLILLDLRMPHIDGCDVVAALRAGRGPNADVPIIAFTASDVVLADNFCLKTGFDAALAKPVAPRDLLAMVAQYTTRQGHAA